MVLHHLPERSNTSRSWSELVSLRVSPKPPQVSKNNVQCFHPDFFVKHGVAVMTVRELFDFVTDPSITCHNIDQYLDKV